MNVALRMKPMTREQFLDWVEQQDAPYEFNGYEPVPMTGGTLRHALLCGNLFAALRTQLRGGAFDVVFETGVATVGNAVRFPDVAVLRAGGDQNARVQPDMIVVCEVVSPSSEFVDRTIKLREYRAVASVQRYLIVDSKGPAIAMFARSAEGAWIATEALAGETLAIPEIGIEIPVDEVFAGVTFDGGPSGSDAVG